ncbi:MAG: AI-2E family transporter [Oscillospiraceae bacterium]|nr:AI-2E family transporter [Oscillospiraceae bacterium]
MRRHFKWDKKYLYWGITAFCVVACAILFYMALNYIGVVGRAIKTLVRILSPFIWGLVITYLLTPLVRTLQNRLFDPLCARLNRGGKRRRGKKLARGLAVFLSEIIMLAVIVALFYLIIPQLYSSIETIIVNSPVYIDSLTTWVTKLLTDFPEIRSYVTQVMGDVNTDLMSWLQTTVLPGLGSLLSNVGTGVKYLLTGLYNLIIGIIVSVYILGDSETFGANAKRLLYSLLTPEAAKKLLEGLDFTNRTFIGFLNGKLLDSAIIGLICYIVCAILDMPYALLVSVIIGLTNIIPFFGPFIGAVPSAIIILMVSPIKCLIFVVFIIILQQVDGNLIGPKILGSSVGINGFWVMFSIILGAGLFSFWGMLLGVPVFVLIYTLINNSVDRKLRRSDLPVTTEEFMEIDYIDPVTLKPVPHEKGEN